MFKMRMVNMDRGLVLFLGLLLFLVPVPGAAQGVADGQAVAPVVEHQWSWDEDDPRIGLPAGVHDAGEAAWNVRMVAHLPRPSGFESAAGAYGGSVSNTDIAFRDDLAFLGNYYGFAIYDIADPSQPKLLSSVLCAGGQGDVSVYGDLLFMSVEETRGRVDCGTGGVSDAVSMERLRGVRIFDISNLRRPRQVAAVQTCRGSHTHTVVTDPDDEANVYVYVSGISPVRPSGELRGCSGGAPGEDDNTSYFQIEVIQVPLANPSLAQVVNTPRIFADPETGAVDGLWPGGDHGPNTQATGQTNQCHDITVFPEIGLAAGACSGNGILLDITDPVHPKRIEEVTDPNFAYWHSATFNNDGTKVLFTDEWGGGGAPRCLATDLPTWGADAIFSLQDGKLSLEGYYKLPVPQSNTENCVAHNGSIIPVPGRDIMVQAWYQGGMSILDFTDPANPFEIAYFDRGPLSETAVVLAGYWSTYWYNGYIYGTEIVRGLDVFELVSSEHLTQNEIEAAKLARYSEFNVQRQTRVTWPNSPVVGKAYVDQLLRHGALSPEEGRRLHGLLERSQRGTSQRVLTALMEQASALEAAALEALMTGRPGQAARIRALLAANLRAIAQG